MRAFRVTVTTTRILVLVGPGGRPPGPIGAFLRNVGTGPVFLGGQDVTPVTGFELPANTTIGPIRLTDGHALWGVRTSGTSVVHVLTQT
jgi:hypothetical protein